MKLIIQIPCLNEEFTLPTVLNALPRKLQSFPNLSIEWLIIDDGSTDNTVEVAKRLGVDHIVKLTSNKGLATAWKEGIKKSLSENADIIINLDADNQYSINNLPDLIKPIVDGKADMVIGYRTFEKIPYFSKTKCILQRLGSKFVSFLSGEKIKDATSGYRAYSRKAASSLHVYSKYTYTLETILHATSLNLTIVQVPINVNDKMRESRLLKSNLSYISKSILTLSHIFLLYNPFKTFSLLSLLFIIPGVLLSLRFLYHYIYFGGQGMIQSLIISSILLFIGFQLIVAGILSHLININRKLIESVK